ncbi:MAG: hypothetical protein NTX52_14805 [Planctomycetota bacterium]|nr:hypothetical protein [Planctomycetota bacterium]
MLGKTYIWLTAVIGLLVIASASVGQEEQWLQYQSSREALSILKDISSYYLKAISETPEGVALPDFKEDKPLFYKWLSPMVKNGYLLIAVDCNEKGRAHDLLYIDSNGDGSLKDEAAIPAYRAQSQHSFFGPVKITFEGKDGPITYHLNFRLCDHSERPLMVSSAGWYEGTITVGEAKKHCVLIDYDVNGTFNDKSIKSFNKCDRIRVGEEGTSNTRFVGNYIEIDGALYRLEVARDGAYIKIAKAQNVVFGNIRLPETISEFAAGGENGLFIFKPEKGAGRLPVGKYCVEHWTIERKDEGGSDWKLEGRGFGDAGVFDVSTEKETEISIGEPAISSLEVADEGGGNYYISQNLAGHLRERIEITCNGDRPPAPKLRIKSEDGKYDRTFAFEYG